ncbi:MAG: c-type cytochrome, partial [Acidobacteriota bacterium]
MRRNGHTLWSTSLGLLAAVYISVSVVDYTDFPRRGTDPSLTDLEERGLALWRRHNCQACHQIYGFGGFLGPDLTNRVTDATLDEELGEMLRSGNGRMPAFDFPPADQEAVLAYLRAVNRTGRSQPRPLGARRTLDAVEHYLYLTKEWSRRNGRDLEPEEGDGLEVWRRYRCGTCHWPFTVGRNLAPDLSEGALDRSVRALRAVLGQERGRMPSFDLANDEIETLSAYLQWISRHRPELLELNDRLLDRQKFS